MDKKEITLIATVAIVMFGILAVILFSSSYEEPQDTSKRVIRTLSPEAWHEVSMDPDVIIIDIRTKEEYEILRIGNPINMDYYSRYFKDQLSILDKDRTYLIYGRTKATSMHTLQIMEDLGFMYVYDLEGGIGTYSEFL